MEKVTEAVQTDTVPALKNFYQHWKNAGIMLERYFRRYCGERQEFREVGSWRDLVFDKCSL
ncbi:MAG: hypothetical protein IPM38_09665 [Ignavibacteria bacterium]|nr:hypothetical protein [Ignavibacteria bacterium]